MSLPAIECVRRGLYSLRANWELVLMQWLGTLAVVVLVVAGLLPPLLVAGVGVVREAIGEPGDWGAWAGDLVERLLANPLPLAAALVGTLAVWTLALVVYSFFMAGTYGVLAAADRQAPAGPPRDYRLFRTFSRRDFGGWGGRYLWRFFWFVNLYAVVLTLLLAVFVALVVAAALGGRRWGTPAAFGIGCGGALPLVFLLVVVALWIALAQADLGRPGSGVLRASRRGLTVLGRRLGAVLLVFLLFVAGASALGVLFLPLAFASEIGLREAFPARLAANLFIQVLQWLVSAAFNIALAGTLVALMRSELRESAA
jgi:hypothetical protein